MARLYADSVLPQADQAVASARVAYETDRAGFLDLLDAQRSLLQFRLEHEQAVVEYLKSRADLVLAVGDMALLGVDGAERVDGSDGIDEVDGVDEEGSGR
jgi:outer membrane protein TolC